MVTATRAVRTFQKRQQKTDDDQWSNSFPIEVLWGIYARQSTPAQLIKHPDSTEMQTDDLKQWLLEKGVLAGKIALFDADLGKSGTLRIDQRTGLQELVERIQADEIKAVLVYRVSRLFRDETGVQYNTFAQICKEHHCILATADGMFFNFNNPMHLKMFRYLAEQAAEYLPQQLHYLYEAKIRKARKGYWVGLGLKPWGLIVDYNQKSPTYQKLIVYKPHADIVLEILERFYALEGDFNALCNELQKRPLLFPDFEEWVDERNIPKKSRKRVTGGYHISTHGLKMLLTNVMYLGWIVVLGDIISRDNHFRIVPPEKEYLFWFAFDHLATFTTDGKINEKKPHTPHRFFQKHTEIVALLPKKKLSSPQGKVFIHQNRGTAWSYQIVPPDYTVKRYQFCEIDIPLIDREFSTLFLGHLKETHEFDEYRRWVEEEEEKQDSRIATILKQLVEIDNLQEDILDERLAIRRHINEQIREALAENPILDVEKLKARLEAEVEGDVDRLQKRSQKLETTAAELKAKLPQPQEQEKLQQARQFATFQIEVQKLIPVWEQKPITVRAEFVNLFLEQVVFTVVAPHWIQLDIYWRHPGWGTETLYIYRKRGMKPRWTDEERAILKANYATAEREDLLKLLPTKTWKSMIGEAQNLHLTRPNLWSDAPKILTWQDITFMQEQGISDLNTKYVKSSRTGKAVCDQRCRKACHR